MVVVLTGTTLVRVVTCLHARFSGLAVEFAPTTLDEALVLMLVLVLVVFSDGTEAERVASTTVIHISEWHKEGSV